MDTSTDSQASRAVTLQLTDSLILAQADFEHIALPSSQYADRPVSALDSVGSRPWHTDNVHGTVEIGNGLLYGTGVGSHVIELEQHYGDASNLYTTLDTLAGASYSASFDYSPRQGWQNSSVVEVYWGAHLLATLDSTAVGLQHYAFNVPLSTDSGSAQLTFKAGDSNGFGGVFDNIAVTQALDTGLSNQPILLSTIATTLTDSTATLVSLGLSGLLASSVISDGTAAHTVTVDPGQTVDITGWNTANLLYTAPTDFVGTVTAVVIATAEVNWLLSCASQAFSITVNPDLGLTLTVAPSEVVVQSDAGPLTTFYAHEGGVYTVSFDYTAPVGSSPSAVSVYWNDSESNHLIGTVDTAVPGVQHYGFQAAQGANGYATLQISGGSSSTLSNIVVTQNLDTGISGQPILLSAINATSTDVDATVTVSLSGLPAGSMLSDGAVHNATVSAGQVLDMTGWDLGKLVYTAPGGYVGTVAATVTATAFDGQSSSHSSQALNIVVDPAAPAPVQSEPSGTLAGIVGEPIDVPISVLFPDTGSAQLHTLTVYLPTGASLTDGTHQAAGGSTVSILDWDLSKLQVTLPIAAGTTLIVHATTLEVSGGDFAQSTGYINVSATESPNPAVTLELTSSHTLAHADLESVVLSSLHYTNKPVAALDSAGSGQWHTDNAHGTVEIGNGLIYGIGNSTHVIELEQNYGDPSNLYTRVSTVAGGSYTVSFDYSPRQGWENSSLVSVYWGDRLLATLDSTVVGMQHYAFDVPTSSSNATTQLTFEAGDSNGYGGLLDNIALTQALNTGMTNQPILLSSITTTLADPHASLILAINGLAQNSVISDGTAAHTVTVANGQSVDMTGWDTGHLLFTAPTDYVGTLTASVVATSVHGSTQSSVTQPLEIVVNAATQSLTLALADVISLGDHATHVSLAQGSEVLTGGAGNDLLSPGSGDTSLTGGTGADTFLYAQGTVGHSIIYDFNPGQGDKIDLSHLLQGEADDTLNHYLRLTPNDAGTAVLDVSARGDFTAAGGGAADVTIALVGISASTTINALVAGADPAVKVDHHS